MKNSAVLDPARLAKKIAGRKEMTMLSAMMIQSSASIRRVDALSCTF